MKIEELLTPEEVARLLGLTRQRVGQLVKEGKLVPALEQRAETRRNAGRPNLSEHIAARLGAVG
jgi:hypothetical protein